MHKPMTVTSEDQALRESPTKASLGKTTVRVAAGDVNGDGKADVAATGASSDVKSPRDLATGQASGKTAQPAGSANQKSASDKSPQPNK